MLSAANWSSLLINLVQQGIIIIIGLCNFAINSRCIANSTENAPYSHHEASMYKILIKRFSTGKIKGKFFLQNWEFSKILILDKWASLQINSNELLQGVIIISSKTLLWKLLLTGNVMKQLQKEHLFVLFFCFLSGSERFLFKTEN